MKYYIYGSIYAARRFKRSGLILTDIWKHIWSEYVNIYRSILKVYWPIYVNCQKFRSIYAQNRILKIFIYRSKNEKFRHISVEIWFFKKFHISVNIKLAYIGQYMNFNIDRYMVTYSGEKKHAGEEFSEYWWKYQNSISSTYFSQISQRSRTC